MVNDKELLLLDLSAIAHPIWAKCAEEADPNAASKAIIGKVRELAAEHPYAAICCDGGKTFRHELEPSYKANRGERSPELFHQIDSAREQLAADGFPVWKVAGFEADDVIASAVRQSLIGEDLSVLIVSPDKDLMQLVGPRVRQLRPLPAGDVMVDEAGVIEKLNVRPNQVRDYLVLVGDASDNIKGAAGIGPVKAAAMLAMHGTIEGIYNALDEGKPFQPATAKALRDFKPLVEQIKQLVSLRSDVEIPFAEIARERVSKVAEAQMAELEYAGEQRSETDDDEVQEPPAGGMGRPLPEIVQPVEAQAPKMELPISRPVAEKGLIALGPSEVIPAPSGSTYDRSLDPPNPTAAVKVANVLYASKMFMSFGSANGVMAAIMMGREFGMPAMASLRHIQVISGKMGLSAAMQVALVMKSGVCEYFMPVEITSTRVVYKAKRKGWPEPTVIEHTIEMAKTAGLVKPGSNWEKIPTDMLVARCSSRLARIIAPDIIGGVYDPDELREVGQQVD